MTEDLSQANQAVTSKVKDVFFTHISYPLKLWVTSVSVIMVTMIADAKIKNVPFKDSIVQWDSNYYRAVAAQGYVANMPTHHGKLLQNQNAFFPVFPALLKITNAIIPGGDVFASLLLNLACFFLALIVFYACAKNLLPATKAKYATALFAFFPAAFLFTWVYAEAVTALFIACGLYALSRKKVFVSAIFFCLATATRPNVIVFAAAPVLLILLTYLQEHRGESLSVIIKNSIKPLAQAFVCGLISISGFVAFMLYLDRHTGIQRVWFRLEREGWDEGKRPFSGVQSYFGTLFDGTVNTKVIFVVVSVFINIAILVVLALYMKKNRFSPMSVAISVPALPSLFFALSNHNSVGSLRFALVLLPIFIATADLLSEKKLKYLVVTSVVLLLIFTFFYSWGRVSPFDMGVPV